MICVTLNILLGVHIFTGISLYEIHLLKEAINDSLENLGGKMHHIVHFGCNGSSRVALMEHAVVVMYQHTQVRSQAR